MQTGGWIGDMVLLTPALRALRRKLPEARISMLVRPLVQDLMERNPYLDEVIVYDKRGTQKGIRGLRRMAKELKSRNFDAAVILHPTSVRSAFLASKARIPERVGTNLRGRELFLIEKIIRLVRFMPSPRVDTPQCQSPRTRPHTGRTSAATCSMCTRIQLTLSIPIQSC